MHFVAVNKRLKRLALLAVNVHQLSRLFLRWCIPRLAISFERLRLARIRTREAGLRR
jgi:hypothetical protein